jgi:hypothetical protein
MCHVGKRNDAHQCRRFQGAGEKDETVLPIRGYIPVREDEEADGRN